MVLERLGSADGFMTRRMGQHATPLPDVSMSPQDVTGCHGAPRSELR